MTDKQTLQQLIEGLPASKLPAAERFLTYLQQEDEEIRNTLERLAGDPALYDTDFYAWTQVQAAALRGKDWAALDIENLVEELEGMARSDRRALGSHLKNLLMHLLKWAYQPDRRGSSWQGSLEEAREAIEDLLEESRRSMEAESRRQFAKQYTRARRKASLETGLPLTTFPEPCQWSLEQVLDPDFLPEAPTQEARP
jgi:hypothetical protein